MLKLILPAEQQAIIMNALSKAGRREIGGVIMGEHIGPNEFIVRQMTVHRCGAVAYFVRRLEEAISGFSKFFNETGHNYQVFNYIGEWHSHPSFEPYPSSKDDRSMLQIVQDKSVGANFAVLVIVKSGSKGELVITAHTYLPNGTKSESEITLL